MAFGGGFVGRYAAIILVLFILLAIVVYGGWMI